MRDPVKLEAFRARLERERAAEQARKYPDLEPPTAHIVPGRRWVKVNVHAQASRTGVYMVDADGSIYGIKGYGVPHLGHSYGSLDTINEWDWGGYVAVYRPNLNAAYAASGGERGLAGTRHDFGANGYGR